MSVQEKVIMADLIDTLRTYLTYPFVVYALIVGALVSLCASLLGTTLVLKRFSYIGDGLSHVAFGALAIAAVFNITNNMLVILPVTIISAIILLNTNGNRKIKGDAAIGMLSVSALAIGYLLLNVFKKGTNISGDVCTTLFGSTSILTLKKSDLFISIICALIVIVLFVFLYNKLFSITFDENFASATGIKTGLYNLIISVVTAVIIVIAMNLVGSLLISALIIFPSISAMRVFKSFKSVVICSAISSVVCSVVGLLVSILYSTPAGATIVAADIVLFIVFSIVGFLKRR